MDREDAAAGAAADLLHEDGVEVSACGAAGAAGLLGAAADSAARAQLGLDASSRVLLFGTEGPAARESPRLSSRTHLVTR